MQFVAFRLDSSNIIGSGHMQRCVTLASYLKMRNIDSLFVTQKSAGSFDFIARENGFSVINIQPSAVSLDDAEASYKELHHKKVKTLIIDHYNLASDFESYFVSRGIKVIVIDDLDNRPHHCIGLIDQNYKSDYSQAYKKHTPATCTHFLGPQFALLRPEFFSQKTHSTSEQKVFVFFGGADPNGETLRFIRETASIDLSPFQFEIIVSKGNKFIHEIQSATKNKHHKLHFSPPNISELMGQCRLYFGSGGSITWERIALDLNGVVVSVADNQVKGCSDLHNDNYHTYLGQASSVFYGNIIEFTNQFKAKTFKNNQDIKPQIENIHKIVDFIISQIEN